MSQVLRHIERHSILLIMVRYGDSDHDHPERIPGPPQGRTEILTSATGTSVPVFSMDGWTVFRLP